VTSTQLVELGCTDERIEWLVHDQRLFRVHLGVFAVGRPDLTREGRWLAAVVACTEKAALGRISAAVLWQLLEYDTARPLVIVPTGCSNRGPRDVRVHRSNDITEEDVETVNAIRVTTVLRTLVDLSRSPLTTPSLDAAVRQAARIHRADLQQLRGYRRLARLVRLYDPLVGLTESDLEALFIALCTAHGLPLPQPQRRRGNRRLDFLYADARLVVECDSRAWHDDDVSFLDDRRRDRELRAQGYEVMRFTWAEVVHEPRRVAAEIRAALSRARSSV
jgi:hypothetical protein